jgi:CHAT domain-containing protein
LHIGSDDLKKYVSSGQLRQVPFLHFATHGIADPENPDRSKLVFSAAGPDLPVDYLFAQEAANLDLSGVRLVTLAACDTETGRTVPGEGVVALSRAFLIAGAQSTVSTLWRVGDRTTAELMRRFYDQLADGKTVEESLRTAKLSFAESGPAAHPRFWAGFVVVGDGSVRMPRRFTATGASVTLFALGALLWVSLRARQSER